MLKQQFINVGLNFLKPFRKSLMMQENFKNKLKLSETTNVCAQCLQSSTYRYFDDDTMDMMDEAPTKASKQRITSPFNPSKRKTNFKENQRTSQPENIPISEKYFRGDMTPHHEEKNFNRKPYHSKYGSPVGDMTPHHEEKKSNRKPYYSKYGAPVVRIRGEVLYGKFPVLTAMKARKRQVHKLFIRANMFESKTPAESKHVVDELMSLCQGEDTKMVPVSQQYLNDLVKDPVQGLRQHQGVCADVSQKVYLNQTDVLTTDGVGSKPQVWLIVQSVQDPNNFGAILRSAYYLGVDKVLAHNSCKLSPAVSKVSAGALELMDLYDIEDLQSFLQICQSGGWQVLGTAGMRTPSDGVMSLDEVRVDKNTIIVLGNEGQGLREDITSVCDKLINISHMQTQTPDSLVVDSLNVSVATGIILHDLLRKRDQST